MTGVQWYLVKELAIVKVKHTNQETLGHSKLESRSSIAACTVYRRLTVLSAREDPI